MTILYMDFETYGELPLKTHGTHAYAEKAEIMLVAAAVDDHPVAIYPFNDGIKEMMGEWFKRADAIVFHNSHFDRTVLRYAYDIEIPIEKIHDTMAQAYAHSLPGSLDELGKVFGLSQALSKDKRGEKLIQLFCKPRPTTSKFRRASKETHPNEWLQFCNYAKRDVEAMRAIYKRMPRWNYPYLEHELWTLDQRINDRGCAIDLDLANAAISAVGVETRRLARKSLDLTDGALESTTQRAKMLAYIAQHFGLHLPDLKASTVEACIADESLDSGLRELLVTRLQATTTSVQKFKKLKKVVNSDERLRNIFQFCGASRTGRWAGRLFQPQNLPGKKISSAEQEINIRALKLGCADLICDNVMDLISSTIRGVMIAPKDKKLVIADLSNIEGRVLAWLAKAQWKLDAYQAFDDGIGVDLYTLGYAKAFNVEVSTVTPAQRNIGKTMELALGYNGGVGSLLVAATTVGLDLEGLAAQNYETLLPVGSRIAAAMHKRWLKALQQDETTAKEKIPVLVTRSTEYKKRKVGGGTYKLSEPVWKTCQILVDNWRQLNPEIVTTWAQISNLVVQAIENKRKVYRWNGLTILCEGEWLRIILPSGRSLCYAAPRIIEDDITYRGVVEYTWRRTGTYGGKLIENITQAVARDVMAYGMLLAEEKGFEIILSVHDELVTERLDAMTGKCDSDALEKIMSTTPPWATGLPLAAKGFETYRYRKG